MKPTATPRELTFELWIRPLPTGSREEHDALVARLEALVAEGAIGGLRVRTWGRDVSLEPTGSDEDDVVRRRVERFLTWARAEGVRLPGIREVEAVGVGRMGPAHRALELPQTLLAVFRDDDLLWVAPHRDGDREVHVADVLAAFDAPATSVVEATA